MSQQATNERYGKLPLAPQKRTLGTVYYVIERGLKECLATRQFNGSDMLQILDFFGRNPPECAYCGGSDVERWDHVVPVNEGGETVLGNIVPACQSCDDSKGGDEFGKWMKSENPGAPMRGKNLSIGEINSRIDKIEEYVSHFGYAVKILEDRLDEVERRELEEIRALNLESRRRTERLVERYRRRNSTG